MFLAICTLRTGPSVWQHLRRLQQVLPDRWGLPFAQRLVQNQNQLRQALQVRPVHTVYLLGHSEPGTGLVLADEEELGAMPFARLLQGGRPPLRLILNTCCGLENGFPPYCLEAGVAEVYALNGSIRIPTAMQMMEAWVEQGDMQQAWKMQRVTRRE